MSRRRDAECPSFALRRVGQAGPDVVLGQLRKVAEHLVLGHATSQVSQYVAHGDPRPADTRLPKQDGRINADAVEDAHGASLGQFKPSVIGGWGYVEPAYSGIGLGSREAPPIRG